MASLGSPGLRPYFREGRGRTTWLNLMEVYWALLRDGATESEADEMVSSFRSILIEFTFEDVKAAMSLRLEWQKRGKRISYVDAIGYHLARSRRMLFLTGDPAFRRVPGVMFVEVPD
jgi:tRNA(His) 5'-end guanylyltransferase